MVIDLLNGFSTDSNIAPVAPILVHPDGRSNVQKFIEPCLKAFIVWT